MYEALIKIYEQYGFTQEELISIELKGKEGQEKISVCIDELRSDELIQVDEIKVAKAFDYKLSEEVNYRNDGESTNSKINLPKSNVLKYILEDDSWFVVRPSGTEPKMKVYLSISETSLQHSLDKLEKFKEAVMNIINEKLS